MSETPYVFRSTKLTTAAASQVVTGYAVVTARLVNTATGARTLTIHDGTVTSAATMVSELVTPASAGGLDEMSVPIRCQTGVKVKLNVLAGCNAFIFVA